MVLSFQWWFAAVRRRGRRLRIAVRAVEPPTVLLHRSQRDLAARGLFDAIVEAYVEAIVEGLRSGVDDVRPVRAVVDGNDGVQERRGGDDGRPPLPARQP